MQDLIILNKNEVIIQADNKLYSDTRDNFLSDYGNVGYESIDYNRETKGCILNGQWFCDFPNVVCENILSSIDTLLSKKTERETVPKTDAELEAEQIGAEISGLDQKLKEIEDQIIKAIALGDDELLAELQAMYRELLEEAE